MTVAIESLWPFLSGGGDGGGGAGPAGVLVGGVVGACLGSGVLTHAFGMVVGEGEHPWHHFGSWVVGVEELQ